MSRAVLSGPTLDRLRQLQQDNMPYRCDILAPPSEKAGTNGQPSKELVLIASDVPCGCSPVQPSEFPVPIGGQLTTRKPVWKVSLPYGTVAYLDYTLRVTDDRQTHDLNIVSKVPHHPNATAEIFYCSE